MPLYSSDDEADADALSNLPVIIEAVDPDPLAAAAIGVPAAVAAGCDRPLAVAPVLLWLGHALPRGAASFRCERVHCVASVSGHALRVWLVCLLVDWKFGVYFARSLLLHPVLFGNLGALSSPGVPPSTLCCVSLALQEACPLVVQRV